MANKKSPDRFKLPASAIHTFITDKDFPFANTSKIKPFVGILGQDRAIAALHFGVGIPHSGYNLFVMGESGTGRSSYVLEFLQREAKRKPAPPDHIYVNNFNDIRNPIALELPPGEGQILKKDIDQLTDNLLATFPAVFEHPSYQQQKSNIELEFNQRYDKAIDTVERAAHKHNVALYRDTTTISFTPMREGKTLDEVEFAQLPELEREHFHQTIGQLEELLNESLLSLPQWKRESNDKLRKLNRKTINRALAPLIRPLKEKYRILPGVIHYLEQMQEQLHTIVVEQLADEETPRTDAEKKAALNELLSPNLLVTHIPEAGAPVIHESHPSYKNLFGRIEYINDQGTMITNYQQICPGSLHKANGGYLIIEADKLLTEPFVWEALKRALKDKQLRMESAYADLGVINTITLSPATLPLNIKVILVGTREIYYLLEELDADFRKMFRVLVDFDERIPLNSDSLEAFAALMQTFINREEYSPLSSAAVARLANHSARLISSKHHLSARFRDIFDLLCEAEYIRSLTDEKLIEENHIEQALAAQEHRTNRISLLIREQMLDDTIIINTEGKSVGKVNGLTVLDTGNTSFGTPARITATVFPGSQGVVDIEREVNLGQSIHSKGVMILAGYLGYMYARHFPLAISANIAIEQSYGFIDGDSASLAELCCLISALTRIPLRQCFALTGSVSQYGDVQAVGGVNEKIEGFFELCNARGLSHQQGVIIPRSNVKNLVLKKSVINAVEDNKFHIYAVETVNQALEILTGREVGHQDSRGTFPANTVNGIAIAKLHEMALAATLNGNDTNLKSKSKKIIPSPPVAGNDHESQDQ